MKIMKIKLFIVFAVMILTTCILWLYFLITDSVKLPLHNTAKNFAESIEFNKKIFTKEDNVYENIENKIEPQNFYNDVIPEPELPNDLGNQNINKVLEDNQKIFEVPNNAGEIISYQTKLQNDATEDTIPKTEIQKNMEQIEEEMKQLVESSNKIEAKENQVKQTKIYSADWKSLDSRPLPEWYNKAKIGIFIHWGVYSVPAFGDSAEWFWKKWKGHKVPEIVDFVERTQKPGFSYPDYASQFTGNFFNAEEWADIIENSGAKYVVFTSKHHDGYTMWPSKYSFAWNSMDIGLHQDIVGKLATAIKNRKSLKFGLYYSLYEWYNHLYLTDKENFFNTNDFVKHKMIPELKDLVETYKPETLWLDGDWDANSTYWDALSFLTWLYNESPTKETIVTNDRWGSDSRKNHGDYITFLKRDEFTFGKKVEYAISIDKSSWGYRENSEIINFISSYDIIESIIDASTKNANLLINIGPNKNGIISPIVQQRLKDMGRWLKINGEAIYDCNTFDKVEQDENIRYMIKSTEGKRIIYLIVLKYPQNGVILSKSIFNFVDTSMSMSLLGYHEPIQFEKTNKTLQIIIPEKSVLEEMNLNFAWILKISTSSE